MGANSTPIVPGGLLVTSRVTRLICGTSLVMRVEIPRQQVIREP